MKVEDKETTLHTLLHSALARKSGGSGPAEESVRDSGRGRSREMGLGLTFGVDGEKRFRQSENHFEAVFISIAEE